MRVSRGHGGRFYPGESNAVARRSQRPVGRQASRGDVYVDASTGVEAVARRLLSSPAQDMPARVSTLRYAADNTIQSYHLDLVPLADVARWGFRHVIARNGEGQRVHLETRRTRDASARLRITYGQRSGSASLQFSDEAVTLRDFRRRQLPEFAADLFLEWLAVEAAHHRMGLSLPQGGSPYVVSGRSHPRLLRHPQIPTRYNAPPLIQAAPYGRASADFSMRNGSVVRTEVEFNHVLGRREATLVVHNMQIPKGLKQRGHGTSLLAAAVGFTERQHDVPVVALEGRIHGDNLDFFERREFDEMPLAKQARALGFTGRTSSRLEREGYGFADSSLDYWVRTWHRPMDNLAEIRGETFVSEEDLVSARPIPPEVLSSTRLDFPFAESAPYAPKLLRLRHRLSGEDHVLVAEWRSEAEVKSLLRAQQYPNKFEDKLKGDERNEIFLVRSLDGTVLSFYIVGLPNQPAQGFRGVRLDKRGIVDRPRDYLGLGLATRAYALASLRSRWEGARDESPVVFDVLARVMASFRRTIFAGRRSPVLPSPSELEEVGHLGRIPGTLIPKKEADFMLSLVHFSDVPSPLQRKVDFFYGRLGRRFRKDLPEEIGKGLIQALLVNPDFEFVFIADAKLSRPMLSVDYIRSHLVAAHYQFIDTQDPTPYRFDRQLAALLGAQPSDIDWALQEGRKKVAARDGDLSVFDQHQLIVQQRFQDVRGDYQGRTVSEVIALEGPADIRRAMMRGGNSEGNHSAILSLLVFYEGETLPLQRDPLTRAYRQRAHFADQFQETLEDYGEG